MADGTKDKKPRPKKKIKLTRRVMLKKIPHLT
jgi:hypothetical protein